MALIPEDPNQRKALAVGLGALALFYVFHSFWYSGQRAEVGVMQDRLEMFEVTGDFVEAEILRDTVHAPGSG